MGDSLDFSRRQLMWAVTAGAAVTAGSAALTSDMVAAAVPTATRRIAVERLSVISAKPFVDVVKAVESAISRPDIGEFQKELAASKTYEELQRVVGRAVGKAGLMEFARFDLGFVMQTERPGSPNSLRLLVGNPLIMKEMAKRVPDAGSYAPVTILIDERRGRVHLSYDKMASLLAPYGNAEAVAVARDLDAKIENLLRTAAA